MPYQATDLLRADRERRLDASEIRLVQPDVDDLVTETLPLTRERQLVRDLDLALAAPDAPPAVIETADPHCELVSPDLNLLWQRPRAHGTLPTAVMLPASRAEGEGEAAPVVLAGSTPLVRQ
jgi:hypothetical protein